MCKLLKRIWSYIMNLFQVTGNLSIDTSNVTIDGKKVDLNIVRIGRAEYTELVQSGKYDDSTLYLIEDDDIDACGERIMNVGYPKEDLDAVNKLYVDSRIQSIETTYLKRADLYKMMKEIMSSPYFVCPKQKTVTSGC